VKTWHKITAIALLFYLHIGGLLFDVPRLPIVNETIRNTYFHVPMWFGMVFLFGVSVFYAVRHLRDPKPEWDRKSAEFAHVGLAFGLLGIVTGMFWANYTWGSPWHGDPKQNMAAIATIIYLAYFVLRGALDNEEQRGRLGAVFNIFAFAAMIPLIFIIPRLTDSMHPGNGGNPGFNMYDLDSRMRLVLYPAAIGWILTGVWIANLRIRVKAIEDEILDSELNAGIRIKEENILDSKS
jgi:heme exporter protein C